MVLSGPGLWRRWDSVSFLENSLPLRPASSYDNMDITEVRGINPPLAVMASSAGFEPFESRIA